MNTQLESLKTLREGIASLSPGDQGLAASLISEHDAKGELTEKRWYWLERLAADVGAGDVPDFTQPAKEIVRSAARRKPAPRTSICGPGGEAADAAAALSKA